MSYKIWVKQFKSTEQQSGNNLHNYNNNSYASPRRIERATAEHQAVRKYISKLIKGQQTIQGRDNFGDIQRNVSLDSFASVRKSPGETSNSKRNVSSFKANQFTIKHASKDFFRHFQLESPKIKYVLSEPSQQIKQNVSKNGKIINLAPNALRNQIVDTYPYPTPPLTEPLEGRRNPRQLSQLNLHKVIEKYQRKLREDKSHNSSYQVTPETTNTQRNQSWTTILTKIRDKIAKAKNKFKNCDIHINRIDTDHITMRAVEKKEEMRRTKRVNKYQLDTLRVEKQQKKIKEKAVEVNFNPWSTQEIRLTEAIELCEA